MYRSYFIILLVFFITTSLCSQTQITARLIDSTNQNPVPYATISLNKTSGVISNDNGQFQLQFKNNIKKTDTLYINCLGFKEQIIAANSFSDSIIILNPKTFKLDEVLLFNKSYTITEILDSIKANLSNNYKVISSKTNLFFRTSDYSKINKGEFKIKNSTIKEFNQEFINTLIASIPKQADHHTEILGDLYQSKNVDSTKLNIIKASELYDKNNEMTFEAYEKKINTILRQHVKRDSYFKIKSGIFSSKEQIDSTFFEDKDTNKSNADLEEQKKEALAQKTNFLYHNKAAITHFKRFNFIDKKSELNFIYKYNRYDFDIEKLISIDNSFAWKINFKPKGKAKYQGTFYVNTNDFAIIRLDYENSRRLRNFKLLGITYQHNKQNGIIIYEKNEFNTYQIKYIERIDQNKFGVKRPLKIVEKNKHVKGRRKQNELSGKVHFIINTTNKKELVMFNSNMIKETDFTSFKESPNIKPTYLPHYDASFWKGYAIIEPNIAIKNFKSLEDDNH